MRRYVQVSGAFFCLLAVVQLIRTILAVPIRVGDLGIPVWPSGVAFLVTGGLAIWAFRTVKGTAAGP